MADIIYHLAARADWEAAVADDREYRAPSLDAEGFIHACADEEQLDRTAARLFAGRADLLILDLDVGRLPATSPVVREAARSGEIYPHIYGPITFESVVRIRRLAPQ